MTEATVAVSNMIGRDNAYEMLAQPNRAIRQQSDRLIKVRKDMRGRGVIPPPLPESPQFLSAEDHD